MNKRVKQLIKKHVNIVKKMYPELYIEVKIVRDNILVGIDSLAISNEAEYEAVILEFIKEYDRKGYIDIYWGVASYLTCDKLDLLEDFDKIPAAENIKEKRAANF
jgi:hypothetical protein